MRKYFLTGLAILLPLTITIFIIKFLVNFLTKPFIGMVSQILSHTKVKDVSFLFLSSDQVIKYGSQIIILLSLFLTTLFLGYVTRWFFVKSLISLSDKLLRKIPIVNKVYKTTHEILKSLFISDSKSFKQVVLAPFPSKDTYSLGLISKKAPATCQENESNEKTSVFIPTTPNPTTGFLLMFEKKDLILLKMKTEEAIKYIVSCGVVVPPEKPEKEGEK